MAISSRRSDRTRTSRPRMRARLSRDREPRSPLRIAIRTVLKISRPQNCERNTPRICRHTILTCGNPQWYGKPLKERTLLSRQDGHSSRYWCQQDSVFARIERSRLKPAAAVHSSCCSGRRRRCSIRILQWAPRTWKDAGSFTSRWRHGIPTLDTRC